MSTMTDDQVRSLLKKAGPGPWDVDGPVWNRTVWSSSENRVCFMAHSNGLDDDRDIATSELVAAAPDLARALLQARADAEAAQAQCCMCGKTGLSIVEDGGAECQLDDGRWVCSRDCWDVALAPDAGTAELAKLRGERVKDDRVIRDLTMIVNKLSRYAPDDKKAEIFDYLHRKNLASPLRSDPTEAERDTLAASLAAQTALVETLTGALREAREKAHIMAHDEYDGVWSEQDFRDYTPLADAAIEAAEIATMTPEQRANYQLALDMRAVAKGIAADQVAKTDDWRSLGTKTEDGYNG